MILIGENNASEFYHGSNLVSDIFLGTDLAYTRVQPPIDIMIGGNVQAGFGFTENVGKLWDNSSYYFESGGVASTAWSMSTAGAGKRGITIDSNNSVSTMTVSACCYVYGVTREKYRKYRAIEMTVVRNLSRNGGVNVPTQFIAGVSTLMGGYLQNSALSSEILSKSFSDTYSETEATIVLPLNHTTADEIYPFILFRATRGSSNRLQGSFYFKGVRLI